MNCVKAQDSHRAREQKGLNQGRQRFCLSVTEAMPCVGWSRGIVHSEDCDECRRYIDQGVDEGGQQTE
jgi:hypothetical protein